LEIQIHGAVGDDPMSQRVRVKFYSTITVEPCCGALVSGEQSNGIDIRAMEMIIF